MIWEGHDQSGLTMAIAQTKHQLQSRLEFLKLTLEAARNNVGDEHLTLQYRTVLYYFRKSEQELDLL